MAELFEPITANDLELLLAFQPEGWGDIVDLFKYNIKTAFCHPIKLTIDGKMVAVGNTILHQDTAWLSQIIVHPDDRNRGIGKMITRYLMDHIDKSHYPSILLDATWLGFPVYKSLGFETISDHVHLAAKNSIQKGFILPSVVPFEESYRESIFEMDYRATGERRENKLMEEILSARIFLGDGNMQGVYFHKLGKGLILAENATTGIELMKLRLTTEQGAMIPSDNRAAIDFLLSLGWEEQRVSRRMKWGKEITWEPRMIFNVINGAFG